MLNVSFTKDETKELIVLFKSILEANYATDRQRNALYLLIDTLEDNN